MVPVVDDEEGLELRDYLRVLNRRKWIVVAVTVLVVLAAVVASLLQEKVYRATAELLLQPRSTESIFDPSVVRTFPAGESAQTEIRVLTSDPVKEIVRDEIGVAPSVSVSNPTDTDFLLVSAESTEPARAAEIASAYGRAYVEYRRRQAVSDLEKAAGDLTAQIDELNRQISTGSGGPNASGPLVQQRNLYVTRLDQIRLAITQKTGGAQLVTPASAPTSPVRPTPIRNGAVALVVGLLLGVGLAFLRDYLDDTLKSKDDVERAVPGLTVLGLVPALTGWRDKNNALVVSLTDAKSPAAEAYRSLRTSIQFLGVERPLKLVQVTSPSAAEGKTTTIANLAVALAGAGQRVVAIDCDLRRPRLHQFFGLDNERGITSVLVGQVPLSQAMQDVPAVPNLSVLASGPVPPNPSELLGGVHMGEVLGALAMAADIVLIDCPPVLPVTDAAVLSQRADGTLLVVTARDTERRELHRAREVLTQVGAPLLGVVLNGVGDEGAYGYNYRYQYAYSEGTASPRRAEVTV